MKVVINNCFGGFSLSPLAVKRMAELNGRPCYLFNTEYKDGQTWNEPITLEDAMNNRRMFFSAYSVSNPDEYMTSTKDWHKMTDKEKTAYNKRWDEISLDTRPDNRSDPKLIQVVEELGEKANGGCSSLKIVEIPDGIEYVIEEYDGNEHIAEKHETWS